MSEVRIREVVSSDLDAFFLHGQDAVARHQAAFVPEDPSDRVGFDAHWARVLAHPSWVARTVEADSAVVGHIIRFDIDGEHEITYWIDRGWWGRGVATRAVRLMMSEAPERPVFARLAADNIGSLRVLEKSGFVVVGGTRGYSIVRDEEIDELVMRLDR